MPKLGGRWTNAVGRTNNCHSAHFERRAQQPPAIQDDTTATIAVMLRVLPPPRALLAIADSVVRTQIERFISAEILDFQAAADEREALSLFTAELRPVVITDSLELIRKPTA